MIVYFYDETGRVDGKRSGSASGLTPLLEDPEVLCIESDHDYDISEVVVDVDSQELVFLGPPPSKGHLIDTDLKAWAWDADQAKSALWEQIKWDRYAEEFGTFVWNEHTFDCDEVSQRRIQGAVQLAALDTNTVVEWTLADNTVQTFNATELQQIGQALGAHVNACHVKARGLREQINAAESEAELSVISW